MNRKMGIIALTMLCTTGVAVFSINNTTYALYKDSDEVSNNFTVGNIDIKIDEKTDSDYTIDFKDIDFWNGDEADKIVRIQNLSTADAFIRVSIVPRWVDAYGNPFAGDTNIVEINFVNEDKWYKDSESNYYYYKEIVDKDKYTKDIMKSVSLNFDDMDIVQKRTYMGKKLTIDIRAEAVQANGNKYEEVWNDMSSEAKKILNNIER